MYVVGQAIRKLKVWGSRSSPEIVLELFFICWVYWVENPSVFTCGTTWSAHLHRYSYWWKDHEICAHAYARLTLQVTRCSESANGSKCTRPSHDFWGCVLGTRLSFKLSLQPYLSHPNLQEKHVWGRVGVVSVHLCVQGVYHSSPDTNASTHKQVIMASIAPHDLKCVMCRDVAKDPL